MSHSYYCPTPISTVPLLLRHHGPTPYGTMGRHHTAPWADTIRTMGIVQDNVLHLTVQIHHLHHCAGKFPTLDGGELSLRTIVQDNVLHLTVQIRHLHHCAEKFPALDGGELSLRTIVQDNVLHLTVQIRHLHHCAEKFPALDGGELSLRTIVQEDFLHFTQKAEIFPTRAGNMFPTLSK